MKNYFGYKSGGIGGLSNLTRSLIDSNELLPVGSYFDLVDSKSGMVRIVFGNAEGYAEFLFDIAGNVTLINFSSNVFTALQSGTNHIYITKSGSKVRIVNEMGATIILNIEIKYTS